ncbi:CYTH domain-containing protein [Ancylomarina sp. 16SWW S1-10-2]|uniref:CYTH domain-containing protein n=1 Tax=Ancylomarina sp. 16SWW S1-10-2 TaxID=2499681 RepID=UPI0012ADD369|nr:CYTH domain-containing protein [Ancylomarina sp. 16SWW S1-10-2]MRT93299.1 CYTH domain-containing protein [Ancylomarina sp. 16SWW S1-10-2]
MATEIERKYLIKEDLLKLPTEGNRIVQGYLWSEKEKSMRIRITKDKSFLTIKTGTNPLSRLEYEYEIPMADAEELIHQCDRTIKKTRFRVLEAGMNWEIDVFEGENKGLIVAEIELTSKDQKFEKPEWLKLEVTQDKRYLNVNLVNQPISLW